VFIYEPIHIIGIKLGNVKHKLQFFGFFFVSKHASDFITITNCIINTEGTEGRIEKKICFRKKVASFTGFHHFPCLFYYSFIFNLFLCVLCVSIFFFLYLSGLSVVIFYLSIRIPKPLSNAKTSGVENFAFFKLLSVGSM